MAPRPARIFLLDRNMKADRKDRRLLILAAHIEAHAKPGSVTPALVVELQTMARWLGLESVVVAKQGDLGRALTAAVRSRAEINRA
jgi:uncharacterized protein YcaQ